MPSKPKPSFAPRRPPVRDPAAIEKFVSGGAAAADKSSNHPVTQSPKGRRGLVQRSGGRERRRLTVYLPPELGRAFAARALVLLC